MTLAPFEPTSQTPAPVPVASGGMPDVPLPEVRNEAIKALLTDEQKAQFDKLMPAGGRRGGGF